MKHWTRGTLAAGILAFGATVAVAQSGMVGKAEELPDITLSSGAPLADKPLEIKTGTYYELTVKSDGSAEKAISGPAFFRNCWVDEIVINDIEVRPLGVDSIEFDDEGEAEISFICIKPGVFELTAPGTPPLTVTVK
ncbi:MAG: hypothetical protein AB7P20_19035 [Rhizobiaceae bacterium]